MDAGRPRCRSHLAPRRAVAGKCRTVISMYHSVDVLRGCVALNPPPALASSVTCDRGDFLSGVSARRAHTVTTTAAPTTSAPGN